MDNGTHLLLLGASHHNTPIAIRERLALTNDRVGAYFTALRTIAGLKEAVLVMRAAAAYSTAIKNTSDMMRHTLRIEKSIDDTEKDLPELVIKELTQEEIRELRKAGAEEMGEGALL